MWGGVTRNYVNWQRLFIKQKNQRQWNFANSAWKTEITESDGTFWFSEGHRSFAESFWVPPSKNSEKDTKKISSRSWMLHIAEDKTLIVGQFCPWLEKLFKVLFHLKEYKNEKQ